MRFVDQDGYPCQKPPWGELNAVNVNTGEIAWRVPLGSYPALEGSAFENKGTINMGGSMATAGGVVFIGATLDAKFRAFDSHTGKELWTGDIGATADAVPITYQGRDGKQYVVVTAGGPGRFRGLGNSANDVGDSVIAFTLP